MFGQDWKIYSRNEAQPPQFVADGAVTINSLVTDGSVIEGTIINSLISSNVKIGKGALVKDSIIFADTTVGEGCHITRSILDEKVQVEANVTIGGGEKIAVVAADVKLGTGITINAGEMVERDRG